MTSDRTILITGVTGNQGGAVAKALQRNGFHLRGLTRKPDSEKAATLARQGINIVKGDLDDEASLRRALAGAWGVFGVQNAGEAGAEREEAQGKRLAKLAREAGVQHYVYASVGSADKRTGVPHFDSKGRIEETVRDLRFPSHVILRPPDVPDLGAIARQAMIGIFQKRDPTAVDGFFSNRFVQHDPNVADGLAGLRAFVTKVMTFPRTNIAIYRTVVDGNIVMLHSKYESWPGFSGPVIAFDLFRFNGGKIVEHWGGQAPEAGPNPSGHTQVDGPTAVTDREQTEANRSLVRSFKQIVTVELHFDRVARIH